MWFGNVKLFLTLCWICNTLSLSFSCDSPHMGVGDSAVKMEDVAGNHDDEHFILENASPCEVTASSSGLEMNCRRRSLTQVSHRWFPCQLTKLNLASNHLVFLPNDSLANLSQLRWLDLSHNGMQKIEDGSFDGLASLEYLDLHENEFRRADSFPHSLFRPLVKLNLLKLDIYALKDGRSRLSPGGDVFRELSVLPLGALSLKNLEKTEIFELDQQICLLKNLSRLHIDGLFNSVTNSTLQPLSCLPLVELSIRHLINTLYTLTSTFSTDFLEPVPKTLRSLRIDRSDVGLKPIMESLKHLDGLEMYEIVFNRISLNIGEDQASNAILTRDGIIGGKETRFLKNVCVERLQIFQSNIVVVLPTAFPHNSLLGKCLKHLDLSGNILQGTVGSMYSILTLPNAETLVYIDKNVGTGISSLEQNIQGLTSPLVSPIPVKNKNNNHHTIASRHMNAVTMKDTKHNRVKRSKYADIYISNSLKNIVLHFAVSMYELGHNMTFKGAAGLETFIIRKCVTYQRGQEDDGFHDVYLLGIEHARILDLSFNDLSLAPFDFLETISPNTLKTVILANTNLNPAHLSTNGQLMFYSLKNLTHLDISSNSLAALNYDTFRHNEHVESVILRDNRFQQIPFDMSLTRQLQYLDLRKNAISQLPAPQRAQLDLHIKRVPSFQLLLNDNILSCNCSSIPFLQWLDYTSVSVDNGGNYTCMTSHNTLSHTSAHRDLKALWRKCHGKTYLAVSAVMLAAIIIGFLMTVLVTRHGNYLRSVVFQMFVKDFTLKQREDYTHGVYIGYADKEYGFPCTRLLPYIEDELKLTGFVLDRDMRTSDAASGIMEAVQSSWRVVLVVGEAFLADDQWSDFTVRVSGQISQTG